MSNEQQPTQDETTQNPSAPAPDESAKEMTEQEQVAVVTKLLADFLQGVQKTLFTPDGVIIAALARLIGMMIATAPFEQREPLRKYISQVFDEIEKATDAEMNARKASGDTLIGAGDGTTIQE